jgi:hypothetical protein
MSDRVVVMQEGHIQQIGTPREVYEEPCNLNVGQFIGEANIFEGKIAGFDSNSKQITLDLLGKKRSTKSTRYSFAIGEKVHVLIRPEDVRVWQQDEVDDTSEMFKGTILEVIYKGTTVDLIVRLENEQIIAATEFFDEDDEKLSYKLGETVWVNWQNGWRFCYLMKSDRSFRFASLSIIWVWFFFICTHPLLFDFDDHFLSHNDQALITKPFTLEHYRHLLNPIYWQIFQKSLIMAFITTLLSLMFGYPFAYIIANTNPRLKALLLLLVIIPFWTSSLIRSMP